MAVRRSALLLGSAAIGVASADLLFGGLSVPIPGLKAARALLSSKAEPEAGVDYAALRGRPQSFAQEAGAFALAGETPAKSTDGYAIATFAGGCFWGTELHFQRVPGVIATCVGYTQGKSELPTYNQVCSGRSGHTEACQILYDPSEVSFGALCDKLLQTIDPTLRDQVGFDVGTQYRHGIYTHTSAQRSEAQSLLAALSKKLPKGKMIHTECKPAEIFWPAEEYHQQYLLKGGRFGSGQSAAKGCTDKVRCYG